jgi:cytochrome c biogenesis protein CcmG, thiol:disulfide interchange protein DsbE
MMQPTPKKTRLTVLPVLLFLAMAVAFGLSLLSSDPSKVPSALLGKDAPKLTLAGIDGLNDAGVPVAGLELQDLATGTPTVVNFWASWCAPCVAEHPLLLELKRQTGVRLVGINHKDQAANARRFLGRYGNPFSAVGVDANGRAAIEWGVYGMPETFVLDGHGRIVHKHIGPINAETLRREIIPALARAARGVP